MATAFLAHGSSAWAADTEASLPGSEALHPYFDDIFDCGVSVDDRHDLLTDPAVQAHMEREVREHLGELSRFETPKKIALLAEEFSIEAGTLTPSMKVRRRVVQERFSDLIDREAIVERVADPVGRLDL